MQRRIQSRVKAAWEGISILDFLVRRFPYHTTEGWAERLADQRVGLNGGAATPDRLLATGDLVDYTADDTPEPRVNLNIRVIHEDADLIVVDKPPNLPCHPGGRYFNHTLWAELKRSFGVDNPSLVNRIDRETSGLVIVAKNDRAARICCTQFATRRVTKRYIALVEGRFQETLTASGHVVPDPVSSVHKRRLFRPASMLTPDEQAQQDHRLWTETAFRSLGYHGGISVVEAVPHTGRLHQIRATLHALGFPVVGDKLYGPDAGMFLRFCTDTLSEEDRRQLRITRQALHASSLELRHPEGGHTVSFQAAPPEDMLNLMGPLARLFA
jgi:23S rRNA pseudouridine955/2504/2580 synthase/23S rRNA pseudouridine1911/1915/1917 synthase